ncbi:hypothetical protein [Bacillus proteolyticus]|uniref:hypothetical protein n=1 Tax=Bacillus proteolyticus TaxID=2026192 RepID=UPI003D01592F
MNKGKEIDNEGVVKGTSECSKAIVGARKIELSDFTKEILKTKLMNSLVIEKWCMDVYK